MIEFKKKTNVTQKKIHYKIFGYVQRFPVYICNWKQKDIPFRHLKSKKKSSVSLKLMTGMNWKSNLTLSSDAGSFFKISLKLERKKILLLF